MDIVDFIGIMASAGTTLTMVPQLVRVWRTRSVADLSVGMYLVACGAQASWFAYGLLRNDIPVISSAACTFVIALAILVMKIKWGK